MRAEAPAVVSTVYGRSSCHLCDEMVAALEGLHAELAFAVEWVDVDSDAELVRRYGERVPVLAHGSRELCHYRLEAPAVTAYLSQIG
jgi:hypothetical protein